MLSTGLPLEVLEVTSKREVIPSPITSSMNEPVANNRERRQFNFLFTSTTNIVTVTATSTLTSYNFVATTIKKTATIGNANQLVCLPAGYIVC